MMKNIYVTPSNRVFYENLVEDAAADGETNWTIHKTAQPGDAVALYVCAPISALVAVAEIAAAPVREDDPHSPWFGKYLADMCGLRMLAAPFSRAALLEKFPTWRYFYQPRNAVAVPTALRAEFAEMLTLWRADG